MAIHSTFMSFLIQFSISYFVRLWNYNIEPGGQDSQLHHAYSSVKEKGNK